MINYVKYKKEKIKEAETPKLILAKRNDVPLTAIDQNKATTRGERSKKKTINKISPNHIGVSISA